MNLATAEDRWRNKTVPEYGVFHSTPTPILPRPKGGVSDTVDSMKLKTHEGEGVIYRLLALSWRLPVGLAPWRGGLFE
jgi:hypothetical protein